MCWPLFTSLLAMSFLWVGSQIPLYLYGSVLPDIYSEIGGAGGRWLWMVIGYLIPNSALCPFVGALSDIFGRKYVAAFGQVCLLIGPIVVSTAHDINIAIGGQVISGLGAGLNELIALAGTSEIVPVKKRGAYVGFIVFTILKFLSHPKEFECSIFPRSEKAASMVRAIEEEQPFEPSDANALLKVNWQH